MPKRTRRRRRFEEAFDLLCGCRLANEEALRLIQSLALLGPRVTEAVLLRQRGWTLVAIGSRLGVTRERVRQILDGAVCDVAEAKGDSAMGYLKKRVVDALDDLIAARKRELQGLLTIRRLLKAPAEAAVTEGPAHGEITRAVVDVLLLGPKTTGDVWERVAQSLDAEVSRRGIASTLSSLKRRGILARDKAGKWSLVRRGNA